MGNTYTTRGVVEELGMNLPSLNTTSLVNASASTYPAIISPGPLLVQLGNHIELIMQFQM